MDLSIIIPMYNHEKFVEQSVRSILKDLAYNVEVIIINDASTDSSLIKVKQLQKEFNNIIILSNDLNLGCAYSINRGLEIAKGTYVGINSSDDFVEDGYYQKMLDIAFKENADVVCANIAMYNDKTQEIQKCKIKTLNFAIDIDNEDFNSEPIRVKSPILLGHWTASSSSTKIIKKELYDKYKFSGSKANDIPCIYPILASANKIIYYPELYKFYRIVEKSLSRSDDVNSYNSVIDSIVLTFKLLDGIYAQEEKELLFFNNCMSYFFNCLTKIVNDNLRNNCIEHFYNKLIDYDSQIFIKMKSSKYLEKMFTFYNIAPEQYDLLTEDLNKFLLYVKKTNDDKILMAMEEKNEKTT